jgi:hypothetical protein
MTDPTQNRRGSQSTADEKMTKSEKDRMENQVEEFEGPQRREIRGEEREPAEDPGVAHS